MSEYDGWRRLDLRSVLTAPVSVIRQAGIPALAGLAGLASSGVGALVLLPAAVGGAVLIGLLPWLTTQFRLTATHLEVRRGLLNRRTVTARLDRVRGVQLEANVLHRLLGLAKVAVGTGVDEGQIELNALSSADAERLRRALLHAAPGATPAVPQGAEQTGPTGATGAELARLDWSWLRFAPLNLRNLLIVVAALGAVLSQVDDLLPLLPRLPLGLRVEDGRISGGTWDVVSRWGLLAGVAVVLGLLLLWVPGACLGFAVRWGGLRITREPGREGTTLRRTFGLLTQREATVEEAKVRGAVVTTPLLVGLARGAELALLTTGLDDNEPDVLPTAPRSTALAVAADVLGERAAMEGALVDHGPRPRRRYHRRNLLTSCLGAAPLLGAAAVAQRAWDVSLWSLAAVLLLGYAAAGALVAEMRARRLGHAVTERYLVARTGSFTTRRTALESDAIVGWRVRQTFWDRRLGLATLTATTAAGPEHVLVPDVPVGEAVAVAAAATPQLLAGFTRPVLAAQK